MAVAVFDKGRPVNLSRMSVLTAIVGAVDGEELNGCAFCVGRQAGHFGDPASVNRFPSDGTEPGTSGWHDSEHALWAFGHAVRESETGRREPAEAGARGYERRTRVIRLANGFHPPAGFLAAVRRGDADAIRMERADRLHNSDGFGGERDWSLTYWASTE